MTGEPGVRLTEAEREAMDSSLADSGCHGFLGDHPDLYAVAERIVADRVAALTQDCDTWRAKAGERYRQVTGYVAVVEAVRALEPILCNCVNPVQSHGPLCPAGRVLAPLPPTEPTAALAAPADQAPLLGEEG